MDYLMTWVEGQISNEAIFPVLAGAFTYHTHTHTRTHAHTHTHVEGSLRRAGGTGVGDVGGFVRMGYDRIPRVFVPVRM